MISSSSRSSILVAENAAAASAQTTSSSSQQFANSVQRFGSTLMDKRHLLFERIASASVGALMTSLVVTPLEVVKVRLQSQASLRSADVSLAKSAFECSACKEIYLDNGLMEHRMPKQLLMECRSHPHNFTGTFDALRWIIRCEGVGSLFNGLHATLWMAVPATVLYFATYEELRDRLNAKSPQTSGVNPLVAGASARVFAATCVAPLELIRTNAQAEARPPAMMQMVRQIAKERGLLAFWRGLSPTLWRDVPFSALYWILVEQIRKNAWLEERNSTVVTSVVAGSVSGVASAILTHPFDVIKTRRQVFDLANTNPPTKSTFGMLVKIVRQDGPRGLLVGIVPRCVKVAPSTAIMLTTYEVGKRFFQDHGL